MTIDLLPRGPLWISLLLVTVFMGDTCAYYVGKGLGRRPLAPSISPKKTWEGAIGGFVGGILGGALFLNAFKIHPLNLKVIFLLAILSIIAQLGDLFESGLKRAFSLKDSGKILPGHGGLLDRVDGLMFSVPVLHVYLSIGSHI